MAMLAEPKRRENWTLNPRGTLWANDENKFGQKLMEKFGWSKGKGLGRTEQGMQEHIKVNVKNNSKGIGFKGSEDQWVKHYEGFESVLASLNSENNSDADTSANNTANNSDGEDKDGTSLEKTSKGSKARVHYHKFTRGKDLKRYNADDIGCITGAKRSKIMLEQQEKEKDTFEETEIGQTEKMGGVTTIKGKNIQEYFAEKMAQLKAKASGLEAVKTEEDSPSSEEQVNETLTKKKKKKKKSTEMEIDEEAQDFSNPTVEDTAAGETSPHIEEMDNTDQTSKKKKKKKKNKDIEDEKQEAEEVNADKVTDYNQRKQDKPVEEEMTDQMEIKKKKKKNKKNVVEAEHQQENIEEVSTAQEEQLANEVNPTSLEEKKKNKKIVVAAEQQQENIEEVSTAQEPQPANDVNPSSTEKKKKKKKKKRQIAEVAAEESETLVEVEHILKKKRKVSSDRPEEEVSHAEEKGNKDGSNEATNVNLEDKNVGESKKSEKRNEKQEDTKHEDKGQKNGQEGQQDFLSLDSQILVKPDLDNISSSLEKKRQNIQVLLKKMKSSERFYKGNKSTCLKNAKSQNSEDDGQSKETVEMEKEDSETLKPVSLSGLKKDLTGNPEGIEKISGKGEECERNDNGNPDVHSDRHITKPLDKTSGNSEESVDGTGKRDTKSIDTITDTKNKSLRKKKNVTITDTKMKSFRKNKNDRRKNKRARQISKSFEIQHYSAAKDTADATESSNSDNKTGVTLLIKKVKKSQEARHNVTKSFSKAKYNKRERKPNVSTQKKFTDGTDATGSSNSDNKTGVTLLIKKVKKSQEARHNGTKSFSKAKHNNRERKPNVSMQKKFTDGNAVKPERKQGFKNAQQRSGQREQHFRTSNMAPRGPPPRGPHPKGPMSRGPMSRGPPPRGPPPRGPKTKKEPLNADQVESAFQGFQGASIMNLQGYTT